MLPATPANNGTNAEGHKPWGFVCAADVIRNVSLQLRMEKGCLYGRDSEDIKML